MVKYKNDKEYLLIIDNILNELAYHPDIDGMIDAIEKKWVYSWRDKGWRKADKCPALNPDLWEKLLDLLVCRCGKYGV